MSGANVGGDPRVLQIDPRSDSKVPAGEDRLFRVFFFPDQGVCQLEILAPDFTCAKEIAEGTIEFPEESDFYTLRRVSQEDSMLYDISVSIPVRRGVVDYASW